MRGLEVVAGLIAIVLGFYVILNQTIAILTLLVLLSWALILIGIRQIAMGAAAKWRPAGTRGLGVAAGVLSLILGFIVIAYPGLGVATLILLLFFGLVAFGVAEISVGAKARFIRGGLRGFFVVIGVLNLIFALVVLLFPKLGVLTLALLLSVALIVNGIELVVSGAVGRLRVVGVTAAASRKERAT